MEEMAASSSRCRVALALAASAPLVSLVSKAGFSAVFGGIRFLSMEFRSGRATARNREQRPIRQCAFCATLGPLFPGAEQRLGELPGVERLQVVRLFAG